MNSADFKHIPSNIQSSLEHIKKILTFLAEHPGLVDCYYTSSYEAYMSKPSIIFKDPALVGHILGKDGWTRERNGDSFDWIKVQDDVRLRITNAEPLEVDPVVRPQQFPLLLADADVQPTPTECTPTNPENPQF